MEGMLTGIKDSFLQEVKNTQPFGSFVVHQKGGAVVRRERRGLAGRYLPNLSYVNGRCIRTPILEEIRERVTIELKRIDGK
jgi:hypothetical protein